MFDNNNLLLAIVISIAILIGFQFLFPPPEQPVPSEQATTSGPAGPQRPNPGNLPAPTTGSPGIRPAAPAEAVRSARVAESRRIAIRDSRVAGSISLTGARFDDVTLTGYRQTVAEDSGNIVLLSPSGAPSPYYAELGWVAADAAVRVPRGDTVWSTSDRTLDRNRPVVLTWENGAGLHFSRTVRLEGDYLFAVEQAVSNASSAPVTLYPYGLVSRTGTPETSGFFILHEGPIGVLDDTLEEHDYDDLQDEAVIESTSTGGWLGITDKYWLAALVPDQASRFKARFTHHLDRGIDKYQTDYLRDPVTVPAGGAATVTNHVFVGAKEVHLLDNYRDNRGFAKFDLAVDFGWFYFLTKPFFYALSFFRDQLGSFGLSILMLTVLVKLVFFPLANKSYRAMSQMKALQPEMLKLRERHIDDKAKLNQEMMALYKREKVNPAAGCLPILIQIPVFFALYKVLFVAIEMRHAPFYGWIEDLSSVDPTNLFTLFGLVDWGPPSLLHLGLWPILMGISMWAQMRLNPTPADPIQAKIFQFMPLVFTFLLASFPAGLVIYWTWNNLLSIGQQWVIMRRAGKMNAAQPSKT